MCLPGDTILAGFFILWSIIHGFYIYPKSSSELRGWYETAGRSTQVQRRKQIRELSNIVPNPGAEVMHTGLQHSTIGSS